MGRVVHVIQWTGDNSQAIARHVSGATSQLLGSTWLEILSGTHQVRARLGDWIWPAPDGRLYLISDNVMRSDYEHTPVPAVRVTRYEVSCLPRDHDDASIFTVIVENVGNEDRWAVRHNGANLSADGTKSWGYNWADGREPVTDEEHEQARAAHAEWIAAHRFDEQTAVAIATVYAPTISVAGRYSVADALAKEAADA